jgi:hypothetical protein
MNPFENSNFLSILTKKYTMDSARYALRTSIYEERISVCSSTLNLLYVKFKIVLRLGHV